VGGLGGAIPAGPAGVVVVVLGLGNVPGCGGGGVVPPELTSGLLGSMILIQLVWLFGRSLYDR
jgi:hypothetical protein